MHAINIISGISMLGVLIGSAALLIILSVFNGFEKVILSLYSNFTPEIKIEAKLGKTFNPNTPYFASLHKDAHVFSFTEVLQEKALIRYGDKPFLGTIRGVSDDFLKNPQLDSTIASGSFTLKSGNQNFAVIGATIQGNLGVNVHDELSPIQIFSPRRDAENSANPLNEFVVRSINPSGVFAIQQEFDDIAVTPIEFARGLLDQPVNVSSLQLNFKRGTNIDAMQKDIQDKIGKDFTIKNRKEQNSELYKTLNYESWAVYMILTFVLIIAIFNIIGSLTMLVIDKRKDIAILSGLGANKSMIQGIFFFEGMMITAIGCVIGIVLGTLFCLLQQHYGWIKMGAKMTVLDSYPIDLKIKDFGLVLLTVGGISVIAAGISARLSIKGLDEIKQDL
ncbi:MAG TPA: FtsX-like permease family protein [Mucilaginibacter sp.]